MHRRSHGSTPIAWTMSHCRTERDCHAPQRRQTCTRSVTFTPPVRFHTGRPPVRHAVYADMYVARTCGIAQVSAMSGSLLGHFFSDQQKGERNGQAQKVSDDWMSCCHWKPSAWDPTLQAEHVTLRGHACTESSISLAVFLNRSPFRVLWIFG